MATEAPSTAASQEPSVMPAEEADKAQAGADVAMVLEVCSPITHPQRCSLVVILPSSF